MAYLKVVQRRALARAAAVELMRSGTAFHELTLRAVADHLGWPLGTLHRAYSVSTALLNDALLEYEQESLVGVWAVREVGLAAELSARAHRWHAWLADPAHQQMLRYQMDLVLRSESPLAQALPHARTTSQHFHGQMLRLIAEHSGEEYRDLDLLTAIVAAHHDGLSYSFLDHGDRDLMLDQLLASIPLAVSVAQPRRAGRRNGAGTRGAGSGAAPSSTR